MVLMGWKFRPKENCLGKLGDNLSSKGEKWAGGAGYCKVQLQFSWEMALEPFSS